MFTGIIESTGKVERVETHGTNKTFYISSPLSSSFKPDQSVSHNGVCLTVEAIDNNIHRVTAIEETLERSDIGKWQQGDIVNIERCMLMNGRLDGHIVQGHVDTTSHCLKRKEKRGSWEFQFELHQKFSSLVVEKDSICVNGISLTAFNVKRKSFDVAIIPYTYDHTCVNKLLCGDQVNLEFNIIGKYIKRYLSLIKK